ncbi:hypothetical protein [Listeria booriae]|uniref:hypothetical protein n=1 Tax=Listeria booriae TaxID=1552123 RepID=UPI00162A5C62|nr:hypothetical protein [Listeria booriae]MBC1801094.1 hypothetical protein [Listeria booriae]
MKTKEFKQSIERLGFTVRNSNSFRNIYYRGIEIGYVSRKIIGTMATIGCAIELISERDKDDLLRLMYQYSLTPIAEREEPKLYYLKCPITKMYLNQETQDDDSFLWTTSKRETSDYRTKFTRAEIEAYDLEHLIEEEVPNNER